MLLSYGKQLNSLKGTIDVLVGGPPCQGFSCAGRRRPSDPRNELFTSYLRIVDILRPTAVLIENVRGFTMDFNGEGGVRNYAHRLREELRAGYDVFEELLDLSQFGVPQSRTRYFLLALDSRLRIRNPFDTLRERLPSFLRSMRLKAPVSSSAAILDLEISRGGKQDSVDTLRGLMKSNTRTH